jgi:hypothetical protein
MTVNCSSSAIHIGEQVQNGELLCHGRLVKVVIDLGSKDSCGSECGEKGMTITY